MHRKKKNYLKELNAIGEVNKDIGQVEIFKDMAMRQFHHNFSFLFLGYNIDCYYWEVVVILRKSALSLIAVSLALDPLLQGTVYSLVRPQPLSNQFIIYVVDH